MGICKPNSKFFSVKMYIYISYLRIVLLKQIVNILLNKKNIIDAIVCTNFSLSYFSNLTIHPSAIIKLVTSQYITLINVKKKIMK